MVVCDVGRSHTEVSGRAADVTSRPIRCATSPRPSGTRSHEFRFISTGVAARFLRRVP